MPEQSMPTSTVEGSSPGKEYGPSYYANYWGGGGPYERNERWMKFFDGVAEGIVRDFHPSTVLDAGCALGLLVESFQKLGVGASGVDVSEYAISEAHESVADRCRVGSLTEPLGGHYDLITCIEVLEHIPPEETDTAIANLCAATDTLVFSSTPADYGEPTHLNVLPPEAWAAKLAQQGFLRDVERDLSYLSPWATVFVRREQPLAETVRAYDRSWWRIRREVNEVRSSLQRSQQQLTEVEALREGEGTEGITAELDSRQAEILRLRDQLVAMNQELGAARGKVAMYEDREKRLANVKKRAEEKIPLFGKLAGKLWTLLSGRR
jgi:SAM-dependent methyltransferase